MGVRTRYETKVAVSSTTAEDKDLANLSFTVVNDDQGEGCTIKAVLAAGAVDVQIPLGVVAAAKFLMIRTNAKDPTQPAQAVSIKRNSNLGEAVTIAPLGTKEGLFLLTTTGLTALYASNASSTVMELIIVVAGD